MARTRNQTRLKEKHGKSRSSNSFGDVNSNQEFPVLSRLGLYASSTTGDGNCLFRALSDQTVGNESDHVEIRTRVVRHIRDHRDRFEAFVGEFGESFDQYTTRMAQDASYGGHLEIVAFTEEYGFEVAIYQSDSVWMVQPQSSQNAGTVHLAYHTWEHYSSVRNKAGPHSGVPGVRPDPVAIDPSEQASTDSGSTASSVPQWKVDIVLRSVPDVSETRVKEMLAKADYAAVVEQLLMEQTEEDVNAADVGHSESEASPELVVPELAEPELAESELAEPALESAEPPATEPTRRQAARAAREQKKKAAVERKMAKAKARKAGRPGGQAKGKPEATGQAPERSGEAVAPGIVPVYL